MRREDHELLAGIANDTPMGRLLRRYWTPALLSWEIVAGGAPVRVKLMGEDLIAFRNPEGRAGLVGEHCAHRGASLYFAKSEACGLRCWYHGWAYDLDGNCVDQPNEPPQTQFKERVKHTAYPCVERNGVIWAYMGPPDKQPAFPELEWNLVPEGHVYVSKRLQECHWSQALDNALDPSHVPFLHGAAVDWRGGTRADQESIRWTLTDVMPKFEVAPTANGLLFAAWRPIAEDSSYWRVNQWFMPAFTTIPGFSGDGPLTGHAWIPADAGSSWVFAFSWHPTRQLTADEIRIMKAGSNTHSELIPGTATPIRNKTNGYADADTPPRQPWARVTRLQDQDTAITESMGPLYDRTKESLSSTDVVIVNTRRRLIAAARQLEEGVEPPTRSADYRLRPVSVRLPREVPSWQDAVAEWIAARPETFRASV